MSRTLFHITRSAVVAAALLFAFTTPGHAQAKPIVRGQGAVIAPSAGAVAVKLSLREAPGGGLRGRGISYFAATGGRVSFELTSYEFVGNILCMAGPITAAHNAPPGYAVGATIVFCIEDNEGQVGSPPDKLAGAVGPPNLTIQQILAMIGPPPPQAYQPLVKGDFKVF